MSCSFALGVLNAAPHIRQHFEISIVEEYQGSNLCVLCRRALGAKFINIVRYYLEHLTAQCFVQQQKLLKLKL